MNHAMMIRAQTNQVFRSVVRSIFVPVVNVSPLKPTNSAWLGIGSVRMFADRAMLTGSMPATSNAKAGAFPLCSFALDSQAHGVSAWRTSLKPNSALGFHASQAERKVYRFSVGVLTHS